MLLNYARFRHDDEGDYGRVKRQQQVLETVMSKMKIHSHCLLLQVRWEQQEQLQ